MFHNRLKILRHITMWLSKDDVEVEEIVSGFLEWLLYTFWQEKKRLHICFRHLARKWWKGWTTWLTVRNSMEQYGWYNCLYTKAEWYFPCGLTELCKFFARGVRDVATLLSLMNRLNKTESAILFWFGCSRGIDFIPEFLYPQQRLLLTVVIFFGSMTPIHLALRIEIHSSLC